MHRAREYGYSMSSASWYSNDDQNSTGCNSPFIARKSSTGTSINNVCKIGTTATTIYNDTIVFKTLNLASGASIPVMWEIDWNRPMIKKDIALSVWAP